MSKQAKADRSLDTATSGGRACNKAPNRETQDMNHYYTIYPSIVVNVCGTRFDIHLFVRLRALISCKNAGSYGQA